MELSERDKKLIKEFCDSIAIGYSLAFNPFEVNDSYMKRFVSARFESCTFNNEFVKLHLDILQDINDTWDGYGNNEIEKTLKEFFLPTFEDSLRARIKINKKIRKEEIEAENEIKKTKRNKGD